MLAASEKHLDLSHLDCPMYMMYIPKAPNKIYVDAEVVLMLDNRLQFRPSFSP